MNALPPSQPRDRFGRPMRDLRISVMDRCNFRCTYCMPESTFGESYQFLRNDERLSFGEIERVCRQAALLGVSKLRLTGGEPLLRPGLPELVRRLRGIDGIDDLALTTNGVLLPDRAAELRAAGLHRVTVSLDALNETVFGRLSGGRGSVAQVLAGIEAARAAELPVKINTVIQRGVNEDEVLPIVERFRGTGVAVRFIEFMDVGNRNGWNLSRVVPSRELAARVNACWPISPLPPRYAGEVAQHFRFDDGAGEVGFISSITEPFCGGCTRARLSSDGRLYTCLFATEGTDLRGLLRDDTLGGDGSDDRALHAVLRDTWLRRGDRYSEDRSVAPAAPAAAPAEWAETANPKIEMYYIGG